MTCATCKYWGDPREEYDDDNMNKIVVGTERKCLRIVRVNQTYDRDAITPCGAYTRDASGYLAELWTFPDFGCTLHEPK